MSDVLARTADLDRIIRSTIDVMDEDSEGAAFGTMVQREFLVLRERLESCERELDRRIEPLRESDDPEETEAVRITPTYVLMTRAAADGEAAMAHRWRDERDEARALLKTLRGDANRLCDRNLGGTYEEDCRRTLAEVAAFLARTEAPR